MEKVLLFSFIYIFSVTGEKNMGQETKSGEEEKRKELIYDDSMR